MYRLAMAVKDETRRGVYSDLSKATTEYLEFVQPSMFRRTPHIRYLLVLLMIILVAAFVLIRSFTETSGRIFWNLCSSPAFIKYM